MEINIDNKRNNPLLNRTEIHFTVIHKGEKTPDRELVRTELAEKLNAKKENVVVNYINPSFGLSESIGYAKVYDSKNKMEDLERKYVLKRNTPGASKKEKTKKEEKSAEKPEQKDGTKEQERPEGQKTEGESKPEQKDEQAEKPKQEDEIEKKQDKEQENESEKKPQKEEKTDEKQEPGEDKKDEEKE